MLSMRRQIYTFFLHPVTKFPLKRKITLAPSFLKPVSIKNQRILFTFVTKKHKS